MSAAEVEMSEACSEERTKVGLADINEEAKENAVRVGKCGWGWNY